MAISQLRDGRWICQYRRDGKVRREYFGRGPEAEAAARVRHQEIDLRRWSRRRPSGQTLNKLSQAYLFASGPGMQESSLDRLGVRLKSIILPILGDLEAGEILPEVLDRYVQLRSAKVKLTTIHGELTVLRAILRWGVRRGLLQVNPMDGYAMPAKDNEIIMPPTPEEVTRIWEAAASHLRRIIALQWFLGCRPGNEVLSLRWDAVDLNGGYVLVTSAKKGGLATRRIALHPVLKSWMEEWREIDKQRVQNYIVNFRGGPIRNPYNAWREAKRKAGITRRLRLYDLRHAFATALIMDGEDPRTVSKLMGHSDISTTLRTYTHATQQAQERAIARVPVFGNGLRKSLPHDAEKA